MKRLKQHPLYKILSLNAISVMINFVLGFFSVQIVARFLGPEGMAFVGNFRNFTSLFKSLSRLGFNNSAIKLYMDKKDNSHDLDAFFSTFYWVLILSSFILGTFIWVTSDYFSNQFFYSKEYVSIIKIFALLLPFSALQVFVFSILNALKLFKRIILYQILVALITFLITFFSIYFFDLIGALYSLAFADVVSLIILLFFAWTKRNYFIFKWQSKIDFSVIKSMGKFSLMAIISAVLIPVTTIWIRSYIVANQNIEMAGIWDASERISSFYMNFFITGIALYYMPKLSGIKTEIEFRTELITYFKFFLPIGLLVVGLVFLFKNPIIYFVFSSEFFILSELLYWQLVADLVKLMSLAMGYQILVQTKVIQYFVIELVFTLMYLSLSYFWIPQIGIEGALKANFFANVTSFLLLVYYLRKTIFHK